MGDRRAEHRHHGIADELFHEAVVAGDRLGERLEQRVLERAHLLGVEPLGERGEARNIGEEHGHLPAVGLQAIRPGGAGGRRLPCGGFGTLQTPGRLPYGPARIAGRKQSPATAHIRSQHMPWERSSVDLIEPPHHSTQARVGSTARGWPTPTQGVQGFDHGPVTKSAVPSSNARMCAHPSGADLKC